MSPLMSSSVIFMSCVLCVSLCVCVFVCVLRFPPRNGVKPQTFQLSHIGVYLKVRTGGVWVQREGGREGGRRRRGRRGRNNFHPFDSEATRLLRKV